MRAFIFSLDAFVAFTLVLVAIYSLIFFSSVPSAYYYLLTQGHFLSRDILLSMSTTACSDDYGVCEADGTLLDNLVAQDNPNLRREFIRSTVGSMVPAQFGYSLELSGDQGGTWNRIYDTADYSVADDPHAKTSRKLAVATQVMTFGYSGQVTKLLTSPFNYASCTGEGIMTGDDSALGAGSYTGTQTVDWGLITCGVIMNIIDNGDGTYTETEVKVGNTHPSNILPGDLVPSSDLRIVKLTIYI